MDFKKFLKSIALFLCEVDLPEVPGWSNDCEKEHVLILCV